MRRNSAAVRAVLAAILAFYLWTVSTSWRGITFPRDAGVPGTREFAGYHNLLADAFLAGQLHLLIEPRPELLALPDPYDPRQNAPYRLPDASLYRGRYYLYWGPAPVLLVFLPFRALTGLFFPEGLAAALFCFGGAAFSAAALRLLQLRLCPAASRWTIMGATASLGLASTAPFLLRRVTVYETSLGFAYGLAMAAVYCLVRAVLDPSAPARWLLVASLLTGLAVGARPPFLLLAALPLFFSPGLLAPTRGRALRLACLSAPLALCLGLHGLYNSLRFDSPTEFGLRYQLAYERNMPAYSMFDAARIAPGLFGYLLQPPAAEAEFPFIQVATPIFRRPPADYDPGPVVGALAAAPLTGMLLLAPAISGPLRRIVCGLTALGLAEATFISAVFAPHILYQLYYMGPLLLAAASTWIGLGERTLIRKAGGCLAICGLCIGAGASFTGVDGSLRRFHPDAYRRIASVFTPIEWLAVKFSGAEYGPVRLRAQFDPAPAGTGAPLVVTGNAGEGDFAFVRYLDHHTIVFGLDHWGAPSQLSRPVPIRWGEPYEIEVDMGSLHRARESRNLFLVKLNGAEVIRTQSEFHRSAPGQVTIGRNVIGGGSCGPAFTGRILEAGRAGGTSGPPP